MQGPNIKQDRMLMHYTNYICVILM